MPNQPGIQLVQSPRSRVLQSTPKGRFHAQGFGMRIQSRFLIDPHRRQTAHIVCKPIAFLIKHTWILCCVRGLQTQRQRPDLSHTQCTRSRHRQIILIPRRTDLAWQCTFTYRRLHLDILLRGNWFKKKTHTKWRACGNAVNATLHRHRVPNP